MPLPEPDRQRKARILDGLRGRSLDAAAADPRLRPDLEAEARSADPQKLVTKDLLKVADAARRARPTGPSLALFSTADVILVPGFLASQLADVAGRDGLIWIDPQLFLNSNELLDLQLAADTDDDLMAPKVAVRPDGAIPVLYAGLRTALEISRYHVQEFGFDWRKNVDVSAAALANVIRARASQPPRSLHLVAHSQGSLVARRALQMLGPDLGRRLIDSLVLLGPATAGSFSAAFGIAGSHDLLDTVRRYGLVPPDGFDAALQSMSGIYQLLPWRKKPINGTPSDATMEWLNTHPEFTDPGFWAPRGVDARRLGDLYGWGESIDASYLNDRTTVILGDQPTVGGVKWAPDPTRPTRQRLVPDEQFTTAGDGTVPDAMARVEGVTHVFKATGAEHMMLPATWAVIMAVRDVLAGREPRIAPFALGADVHAPRRLAEPPPPAAFFGVSRPPAAKPAHAPATAPAGPVPQPGPTRIADVSPPPSRRLRVFSFDPLFAGELDNIGAEQVTVELPWDFADGNQLRPGPVGEYLEVVDFDAASQCFYPPVDLNHPHVLARDGIPVSEGDPRFHQQMAYAVAMNTIRQFEVALGRLALWAPNLRRDQLGDVITEAGPGDEYVARLRVYPHAMREANAYYSPDKKALLFGYFTANGADVGRNLPGGTVFACLSYDIIAHETTHALLDGLHRYFTQPSNVDVFAFHEAFADVVALLQHFSHPEVLRQQIAASRGDLRGENSLGVLAAQFGEATGHRGALRTYLGRRAADGRGWEAVAPDPNLIRNVTEPHQRGAILVAAVFRAFAKIYETRVRDLRRIATGGTGVLPEGDLHPDLVNRMAGEAAKAASHMLRMCVRALDYVPPVDLTFGEYLRAVVTADYDLVADDDLGYRRSVVAAFRDWGIYPADVRSLSVDSLLWGPPDEERDPAAGPAGHRTLFGLEKFFTDTRVDGWRLNDDRRAIYDQMCRQNIAFHDWLLENIDPAQAWRLGIVLDPAEPGSGGIRRRDGRPVFQVHMFRPCWRIGPDGQQVTDVVVEIIQRRKAFFDPTRQATLDARVGRAWHQTAYGAEAADFYFRGGCTLVINPADGAVRYCVRKSVLNAERLDRERAFRQGQFEAQTAAYLDQDAGNNPFAALHADH
jgi:hypothetical protein